jgi:hypothetical protein
VLFPDESGPNDSMPTEWKQEYHLTKQIFIQNLLSLSHCDNAFRLSRDYSYFQGLFYSIENHPQEHHKNDYQGILEEMIAEYHHTGGKEKKDTNNFPLATEYFHFLYGKNRFKEILVIGKKSEGLLHEFLQVRATPPFLIIYFLLVLLSSFFLQF